MSELRNPSNCTFYVFVFIAIAGGFGFLFFGVLPAHLKLTPETNQNQISNESERIDIWPSDSQIQLERRTIQSRERLHINLTEFTLLQTTIWSDDLEKYILADALEVTKILFFNAENTKLSVAKYSLPSTNNYLNLGKRFSQLEKTATKLNGSWTEHYGFTEFETIDASRKVKIVWTRNKPDENYIIEIQILEFS